MPMRPCHKPSNSSQNRSKGRQIPTKTDQKGAHFVMPILTFWGVTPSGASARAVLACRKGKKARFGGAKWRPEKLSTICMAALGRARGSCAAGRETRRAKLRAWGCANTSAPAGGARMTAPPAAGARGRPPLIIGNPHGGTSGSPGGLADGGRRRPQVQRQGRMTIFRCSPPGVDISWKPLGVSSRGSRCVIISATGTRRAAISWTATAASYGELP